MVKGLRVLLFATALAALVAAACGGGDGGVASPAAATPAPTAAPASGEPTPELNGILATKDLEVGENRVSFLLTSPRALVTVPTATVKLVNLSAPDAVVEESTAQFFLWPFGSRGNYVTEMTFDQPGEWRLDVEVIKEDGSVSSAQIQLKVAQTSPTPSVGDGPPTDNNKTARDVSRLADLTTRSTPDPDLYQQTVAEVLAENKPLVVVFASPALCTSPTCGPQVETVEELKEQYKGQAGFIHVEVYDNPAEIQGNLSRARYAAMVHEWGLTTLEGYQNESWVFIFGKDGTVSSRYQGYASIGELAKGLDAAL